MTRLLFSLIISTVLSTAVLAGSPVASQFTYQGKLEEGAQRAQGLYDFTFTLHDALEGGLEVAPPILLQDVPVENGIFNVQLDFGTSAFTGDALFLSIGVREGDSVDDFNLLTPRQPLTAAPYALYALSGNAGPQGEPGPAGPQG
jgi:hypothetical protein